MEQEEKLEEAKRLYQTANQDQRYVLEILFPELRESEDERIRKALIRFHKSSIDIDGIKGYDILAWLEKQGEQEKPQVYKTDDGEVITYSESEGYKVVEPKFKVGDWIYHNNGYRGPYLITNINEHGVELDNNIRIKIKDCSDYYHLWTIQDAKDGDVLVNQNGEMPFIFKECKNNHIYCYCGYTNRKDIFFDRFVDSEGEELHWLNLYHEQAYPATKEQRNLLFQKMKGAGYEWDAEKKELKKIEQKPAWSEEDEQHIDSLLKRLDGLCRNEFERTRFAISEDNDWLKSLKDKVQPQPKQEWNEEDEKILRTIISDGIRGAEFDMLQIGWLKSLKQRIGG